MKNTSFFSERELIELKKIREINLAKKRELRGRKGVVTKLKVRQFEKVYTRRGLEPKEELEYFRKTKNAKLHRFRAALKAIKVKGYEVSEESAMQELARNEVAQFLLWSRGGQDDTKVE